MSFQPLIFLGLSCVVAFVLAAMALSSGAGFISAFLIYSFGGSATLVSISLLSFWRVEEQANPLVA